MASQHYPRIKLYPVCFLFLSWMSADCCSPPSLKTEISYEPSFRTFETKSAQASSEKSTVAEGRKVFGSFVPDIDVCVRRYYSNR
jgi:hypothetical protein